MKITLSIIFACVLLSGCSTSMGLAVHSQSHDRPEIQLSPIVGVVRLEHHFEEHNITGFCEHVSGVDTNERGIGLNMCGGMVKLK